MNANVLKMGTCEFRTRRQMEKTEINSLKRAAARFEKLLASHGLTEDELLADFRALRAGKGKKR
jgi:uncharacterized protein YdcH (DUF465 family)